MTRDPEQQVLARLADATAELGSPWAAARSVFGDAPASPVKAPPAQQHDVVLTPRTVAGQRALIAARSRRKRHRALTFIARRWAG